ncbi:hypothetical protein BST22_19155 [Mycolicibacterium chubuense]|nr:hypothetical protein BST22_19155 [Mycolicibacterium chubuense]
MSECIANGASASPWVASTSRQTSGKASGCGRERVGHISSSPDAAMTTLPRPGENSTRSADPASTAAPASAAWRPVTGRPRKMPRAMNNVAASTVTDHASRSSSHPR